MRLAALLDEIARFRGPVTGIDLANRMGIAPQEVAAMLVALRASGHVGAEMRVESYADSCAAGGGCAMTCPGPEECSMVLDLTVVGLEIRKVDDTRSGDADRESRR